MQVDKINELIQVLINYLNENSCNSSNWLELLLPFLGTLLGATIALIPGYFNTKSNKFERT